VVSLFHQLLSGAAQPEQYLGLGILALVFALALFHAGRKDPTR